MSLPFPNKVLDQHTITLGKTRSGKSSKLRLMVEHLLDRKEPVCIVDPKGDWWGLKSSADGKAAGYPVIIFGGPHADVQITEHSGAQVAELVATGNRPCIIDLGGWRPGARTRFFIAFAEAFFIHTKGQRWLVIDECHNFVPKGKILSPDVGEMIHWGNRLASEGQGKGVILLSASQRPQKVHNDYLTSHETLIACRVIHKADRDAVKDWIDGCGDPAVGRDMIAGLAEMQRDQAWVWSPEIGFGPKRLSFPLFATYDSFKPQMAGTGKLKGWAAVNLAEIGEKLKSVEAEAKANDPKALKAEVSRLTAELVKVQKATVAPSKTVEKIIAVDQRAQDRAIYVARSEGHAVGQRQGFEAGHRMGFDIGIKLARRVYLEALQSIGSASLQYPGPGTPPKLPAAPAPAKAINLPPTSPISTAPSKPVTALRQDVQSGGLSGPQQRVMASLAFWSSIGHETPSREQVAGVAGYSATSGSFRNVLSSLNVGGFITLPSSGRVALAGAYEAMDRDEAKQKLISIFGGPERKVIDALINNEAMTREALGASVGYEPTSGSFRNTISTLNVLGVIEKPSAGQVQISDWAREVLG
jgi:hypothetical protein